MTADRERLLVTARRCAERIDRYRATLATSEALTAHDVARLRYLLTDDRRHLAGLLDRIREGGSS